MKLPIRYRGDFINLPDKTPIIVQVFFFVIIPISSVSDEYLWKF
jgi:hypothetical protein